MSRASLAALFGAAALVSVLPARGQAPVLPEGKGRETVQAACAGCHEINRVTGAGYSPQEWREAMDRMVAVGARMTPAQFEEIHAYLSAHFPERAKPAGAAIAGPVKVSIKEWVVPTPGSRPHDPLGARDGSLWYTGHMANVLGRLDPATGQIREYHPQTPGSGPHGLVEDRAGNIWFTANFKGYIGKLDPKTGKVVEYPMPDPQVRDPHTLLFDRAGILWFTAQSANVVGRLDPATGEIKLVRSPTPRSNPYGMVISSKGVPFFDEFGANKLASIDPRTLAIHEYVLPAPAARPRRIAITSDDRIWYSDYSRGYLGRLDPATGQVAEWASPGGPRSQPYAITAVKDVIWYVESNTKPNMLVRFDPKTERFQSWPIPSGGGVVRNMTPTRDGGLAMALSGVNRVAVASIG